MLLTIAAVIVLAWIIGLVAHVGGLINILLIAAAIMVIAHFMSSRSHRV